MMGWSPDFNWTYEEYRKVVSRSFGVKKMGSVTLDVEHCDRKNMKDIMSWASKDGYRAEEINSDLIRIYRR